MNSSRPGKLLNGYLEQPTFSFLSSTSSNTRASNTPSTPEPATMNGSWPPVPSASQDTQTPESTTLNVAYGTNPGRTPSQTSHKPLQFLGKKEADGHRSGHGDTFTLPHTSRFSQGPLSFLRTQIQAVNPRELHSTICSSSSENWPTPLALERLPAPRQAPITREISYSPPQHSSTQLHEPDDDMNVSVQQHSRRSNGALQLEGQELVTSISTSAMRLMKELTEQVKSIALTYSHFVFMLFGRF